MTTIDMEKSRSALLAWGSLPQPSQNKTLCLSETNPHFELIYLTASSSQGEQMQGSSTTVFNFIYENFDRIVKPEDLTTESKLLRAFERLDAQVVITSNPKKRSLTERAKDAMAQYVQAEMLRALQNFQVKHHAKSTIDGIITLYLHRHEIATILEEQERNRCIFSITKLITEPGFCVGSTYEQRLANIEEKFALLKTSYEEAKKTGSLGLYFAEAFRGDPCFNGRVINLINFVSETLLHVEKEPDLTAIPNKDLNDMLEIYYAYREALSKTSSSSKQGFLEYIKGLDKSKRFNEYYTKDQLFNLIYQQLVASYIP